MSSLIGGHAGAALNVNDPFYGRIVCVCETIEEYPATNMQQSTSVQHGVPILRSGAISAHETMFQQVYSLNLKYLPSWRKQMTTTSHGLPRPN